MSGPVLSVILPVMRPNLRMLGRFGPSFNVISTSCEKLTMCAGRAKCRVESGDAP